MQNKRILLFLLFTLTALAGISMNSAYSQKELHLATFQETAQIIIDQSISQNVTSSITLQSTSIQEIQIPAGLEQRVRTDGQIKSILLTNHDKCVLGVIDQSCILVNVERNPDDRGVIAIQNSTKRIAGQYIQEINEIFDTDAQFHSVFIHTDSISHQALGSSGVVSGKGIISAVYTLPMEDTDSMYEKISAILIPKIIRDGGGFYSIAQNLSHDKNTKMTFSIIPADSKSLLQLRLSVNHPHNASAISEVSPLEFLKVDKINRSSYFSSGFYPLNSIIQVVVLSPQNSTAVSDIRGNTVPTRTIDNELIPTDVKKNGWIFDPSHGELIQGKYIFGEQSLITGEELKFSLRDHGTPETTVTTGPDESLVVVIIIVLVAAAAALFYLKGYKK